jgi:predicted DNA-binding protein (MmcQ/YjbR family)
LSFRKAELALRDYALAFPEATEDFPWGHRAIKVKGKAFIFMGTEGEGWGFSLKLPVSADAVLMLPFVSPTGYGLGKSGWVTARFHKGDKVPLDWVRSWIEESYRAVAPKRLAARLTKPPAPKSPPRRRKRRAGR